MQIAHARSSASRCGLPERSDWLFVKCGLGPVPIRKMNGVKKWLGGGIVRHADASTFSRCAVKSAAPILTRQTAAPVRTADAARATASAAPASSAGAAAASVGLHRERASLRIHQKKFFLARGSDAYLQQD